MHCLNVLYSNSFFLYFSKRICLKIKQYFQFLSFVFFPAIFCYKLGFPLELFVLHFVFIILNKVLLLIQILDQVEKIIYYIIEKLKKKILI